MIEINPLKKTTITVYEGCSDEKFQEHIVQGIDAVRFVNFEGCVKIPLALFFEPVPEIFADADGTRRNWVSRFITFKMQDDSGYLILGNKQGEYTWGAVDNTELFNIYDYLKTKDWFNISDWHASEFLKEKTALWKSENDTKTPEYL